MVVDQLVEELLPTPEIRCSNPVTCKFYSYLKTALNGRSPGLVVMGDKSCLKGCGFESRRRILDGHLDIFHIEKEAMVIK